MHGPWTRNSRGPLGTWVAVASDKEFNLFCVDRYTCRTPHFHMHSHRTAQTTCAPWLKELAGLKFELRPKIVFHPRVMFHLALHSTLNTSTSSLSYLPLLCDIRLPLRHQTCCPRIHLSAVKNHGRMALPRITNLSQVMSPRGSSSTGHCSTNQVRELTIRIILRKLVSKSRPSASHGYVYLTIRQRALQRHPTRTSKTNIFVRCWLHHCIPKCHGNLMQKVCRSEKQIHKEHKLITQNEKARCQVLLEISKLQRNLMQYFRGTVNRVKTRFPKETEVTNRETV